MKKRIWELDALRGVCVLGMVAVHLVYDLTQLSGLMEWTYPRWFSLIKDWGGVLFLLISGVCVTLGSRNLRRGVIVLGCGMVCTAVTFAMAALGLSDPAIVIWFGVLHCLGACMLLWSVLEKLPVKAMVILGLLLALAGLALRRMVFSFPWLIPLGFVTEGFASSDYFPLLPHLGFFLLGAALGRTVYREKRSLLPRVPENNPILRFFRFCGRNSLIIYLLHQPIILAAVELAAM